MARGFARAFDGYEAIVTPSASCAAMVREYHPVLAAEAGDAALGRQVAEVAPRVHDLATFLTGVLGVTDVGAHFPHRVTYHPTCHSLRMMHVGDAPLRLLREVGGIDLVDLPDAETCCGFGGTFSVKNPDVSAAMCADKVVGDQAVAGRGGVRGGQLVPDAHRRRAEPAAHRGADHAPGGDPGVDRRRRMTGTMPTYLGHALLPGRRQGGGGRLPAPPEPHPRHHRDQDQARERGRRARRLGRAAAGRQGDQGPHARQPRHLPAPARGERHQGRRPRALGPRRGRGQRDRGAAGQGGRRRHGGQGQVDGHPGDGAERGPRGRRHPRGRDRPGRAHRAARRTTGRATSWSPRSTRTGPRSGTSSCARWATRPPT